MMVSTDRRPSMKVIDSIHIGGEFETRTGVSTTGPCPRARHGASCRRFVRQRAYRHGAGPRS